MKVKQRKTLDAILASDFSIYDLKGTGMLITCPFCEITEDVGCTRVSFSTKEPVEGSWDFDAYMHDACWVQLQRGIASATKRIHPFLKTLMTGKVHTDEN